MLAETIFGKLRAEVTHHHVAPHLCDHAGGRDRQAIAVAIDDRSLGKRKRKNGQPINQDMIGGTGEDFDGGTHRFVGGAQNVDLVDLNGINDADRPGNFGVPD